MEPAEPGIAGYLARWRPSSLSPQAAAFARGVIGEVAPEGKERAKNLLWAAGKLAGFGIGLGLDAVPEVLLHPSVAWRAPAASSPPSRPPAGTRSWTCSPGSAPPTSTCAWRWATSGTGR